MSDKITNIKKLNDKLISNLKNLSNQKEASFKYNEQPQDTFEKSMDSTAQPVFVESAEDALCTKTYSYKFYPEDIRKMENMSDEEARKYKIKLIKEGKITYQTT